jgi:starch synthase
MNRNKLKIIMLSAEIAPFAKVGGLGDVVGSLPKALVKLGVDVRLMMPLYGGIDRKRFNLKKIISRILICAGGQDNFINIWEARLPGAKATVYFIENKKYFGDKKVYGEKGNSEKFLFFSLAALHALPKLNFQPDIIHCHDFHTAMVPDLLKAQNILFYKNTKTALTIHNLNYQGVSEIKILSSAGLSAKSLPALYKDAEDGNINFMVQGIIGADAVNTVSPTYAKEIKTCTYGSGLERVIANKQDKISGILNGIDTAVYNPAKDKLIKYQFNLKSLDKKLENKINLQKKLGLKAGKKIPLVAMISRFTWQKGVDLIASSVETLHATSLQCQFIFLGTGEKEHENSLKALAKKYPKEISAQIKFDEALAHQLYAAADILLMPSRFEPCGLAQMMAMRYGTVPVVRSTGGLADTVNDLHIGKELWSEFQISPHSGTSNFEFRNKSEFQNSKFNNYFKIQNSKFKINGNGFSFNEASSKDLASALKNVLSVYYDYPKIWRQLQTNGMREDFSWGKSAREYLKMYRKVLE